MIWSFTAPGRYCGGGGKFFGQRTIIGPRTPLSSHPWMPRGSSRRGIGVGIDAAYAKLAEVRLARLRRHTGEAG